MTVDYSELQEFLDWTKVKAEIKFNPPSHSFPILYNHIYWAHMGCNVGSEEGKHRPVLITRAHRNSPVVTVIPLTTQRLNDSRPYHIDLEVMNSTALVEQMRVIDRTRIDKPMYIAGHIASITNNDWQSLNREINRNYSLLPLPADT